MVDVPRILPTPEEAVTAFVDGVVAARPTAARHFNLGRGRWHHLAVMVRAQAALAIARLADEVKQHRLPLGDGQGLRENLASEYLAALEVGPTVARGKIILARQGTGPGVIKAGTRFVKRANPAAIPLPIAAAEYESVRPVIVPSGTQELAVDVRATRAGPHANIVQESNVAFTAVKIDDVLFDTFSVTGAFAAGGSLGLDDAGVKAAARALARGDRGPTLSAPLAGALAGTGVRYAAVIDDATTGRTRLYVADESWGSSNALLDDVTQRIRDDRAGFGLLIEPLPMTNYMIKVEATVRVRDGRYRTDTTEIQENVRAALRSYFDDRSDWYRWRGAAIRAAITRADRRIQVCVSSSVKSARTDTVVTVLDDYASATAITGGLPHWYLAGDGVALAFDYPG